jgi:hypothetical protein
MQSRSIGYGIWVLATCAALAGCSRSQPPAEQANKPKIEVAPSTDPTPASGEVQLAGVLGCGHCSFHVTSDCAACIKTAGGEVYVLDGVQEGSDLWEKRLAGTQQISVTGAVLGTDKVKHVAMNSFEFK